MKVLKTKEHMAANDVNDKLDTLNLMISDRSELKSASLPSGKTFEDCIKNICENLHNQIFNRGM